MTSNPVTNSKKIPLDLSYRHILAIVAPVLVANLAMPLQGAIDVAAVGHFEHPSSLAGLGIATQLWILILVSFNFLQYASSGLSAQALGRKAPTQELADILYRSLGLAVLLALLLWVFRPPIIDYGLQLLSATGLSHQAASNYLDIRYFGGVFELMNYAFIGWFAGQGKTRAMMSVQLLISLVNIVLTLTFVYLLDMGLQGVALGTVIGYAVGCVFSLFLVKNSLLAYQEKLPKETLPNRDNPTIVAGTLRERLRDIYQWDKMLRLFSLNKDIFIRTLLLTLSFAWITRLSAQQGDLIMATNALLLQVLSISAFALDGVAVAAESLSGQTIARKSLSEFKVAVRRTCIITLLLATVLSTLWWLLLPTFLGVMTDISSVYELSIKYRYLAIFLPLVGAGAYWLDGIMFGLTAGAKIRQVAIIVAMLFFSLISVAHTLYGDIYPMAVIWFGVYFLLISRFVVAAIIMWRGYRQDKLLDR